MRRKGFISNHYGFTLIEIIAVLIILGILAAVAVPRYLDMTDDAHEKAVEGAIAASITNYNLAFSSYLLKNETVPTQLAGFILGDATHNVTIEGDLGDFDATYSYTSPNITINITTGPAWFADFLANNADKCKRDITAGW